MESRITREWYFPDSNQVLINGSGSDMYRTKGPSAVRLHRRNNAMMPIGVFRCEIPDASGHSQSIYVGVYPDHQGVGMKLN